MWPAPNGIRDARLPCGAAAAGRHVEGALSTARRLLRPRRSKRGTSNGRPSRLGATNIAQPVQRRYCSPPGLTRRLIVSEDYPGSVKDLSKIGVLGAGCKGK